MAKKHSEILWCVTAPDIGFMHFGIAKTRKQSIKSFTLGLDEDWRWWNERGFRCVRVSIRELPTRKKRKVK